jgi:hypothetical protein
MENSIERKFLERQVSGQLSEADGEVRAFHLRGKNASQTLAGPLVTEDANVISRFVRRTEERKPLDMIPVRMGNKQRQA